MCFCFSFKFISYKSNKKPVLMSHKNNLLVSLSLSLTRAHSYLFDAVKKKANNKY